MIYPLLFEKIWNIDFSEMAKNDFKLSTMVEEKLLFKFQIAKNGPPWSRKILKF